MLPMLGLLLSVVSNIAWGCCFVTIPKEFSSGLIGALIGGVFAVVATWITTRANQKQLVSRFEHESKEAKKERDFQTKQNIYLDAIEASSNVYDLVSRISSLTLEEINARYSKINLQSKVGKINLVANLDTIAAVSSFLHKFSEIYLFLMFEHTELSKLKNKTELLRLSLKMLFDTRSGSSQNIDLIKLNELIQIRQSEVSENDKKYYQCQTKILMMSMKGLEELSEVAKNALISLREELDLTLDKDAYSSLVTGTSLKNREIIERFSSKLQKILDE
jgi:hypothetical protein